MGCFYQTDLITQLPIVDGEPVRALLLRLRHCDSAHLPLGPSEPTDRYDLIGLPLRGTYDGYGWIVAIADDLAAALAQQYFAVQHGVDELDLEALDDLLEDLNPEDHVSNRTRHYGIALVAEPVYQALIQATRAAPSYGTATIGEQWDQALATLAASVVEQPWGHEFKHDFDSEQGRAAVDAWHQLCFQGGFVEEAFARLRHSTEARSLFADHLLFVSGLRLIRQSLQPQSGQGAQHLALPVHQAVFQAALQYATHLDTQLHEDL